MYCQVHKEDGPRNSMAACTQGAFSLGLSGNVKGGHKFFTLKTERVVSCSSWSLIPMTDMVNEHINLLGSLQPTLLALLTIWVNPLETGRSTRPT